MSYFNARRVPIYAPAGLPKVYADRLPDEHGDAYDAIIAQIQGELGVEADGKLGAKTIAAMAKAQHQPGHLIIGAHSVDLSQFSSCVEARSYLDADHAWLAETKSTTRLEALKIGVIHYDVTNDSRTTHRVLRRRELSTHFMIDADGVIYQCHDPLTEVCIHAGSRANRIGLGIDLNNPALREYERLEAGQAPRDEVAVTVHGRKLRLLDYWHIQIEALKTLMCALELYAKIPRRCPRDAEGEPIAAVYPAHLEDSGYIGHYHITDHKIDPAPLDWDVVCPA